MLDDQGSSVARLVKVTFAGAAKAEQGYNTPTPSHLHSLGKAQGQQGLDRYRGVNPRKHHGVSLLITR